MRHAVLQRTTPDDSRARAANAVTPQAAKPQTAVSLIAAPQATAPHTAAPRIRTRALALLTVLACLLGLLFPTMAHALTDPAIEAQAAILVEPTSGTVLYELNADETCYPASTTKIMTALITLEQADLTDEVTVEESDFDELTSDSSVAGFQTGEVLTIEELLYGLLLPSGNDAAYILARAVGGDVETFVQMMNDRASELGCTGTHFTNPCGLHDDDHYTTARDLYLITAAAMDNPTFAQIVATESYDLPATNMQDARTIENTNLLIDSTSSVYYAPAIGVKTGHTTEAGRCLVAAATEDDVTLYAVVLGCADATIPASFTETERLFEWGYDEWSMQEVAAEGSVLETVDVADAHQDEDLEVEAAESLTALLPQDTDLASVEVSIDFDGELVAPYDQGDEVGTATFTLGERELGTVTLVAGNDVQLSALALLRNGVVSFALSPITWVVVGIIVIACIVSVVRERRNRRRGTRYRSPNSRRRR